ncbi:hypothetical protein [Streptomyces sp. NPDC001410]|uniref:hypothetical protein n=1 Tax=Streptomyces sp. NPDC001410 TaxID=3364574 RepID=UPI0036841539
MSTLPERDLPPARHRLLKEHLLTEIRREPQKSARTRWLRPALAAAAVATAAAVTVVLLPSSHGGTTVARPPATATALLEDIALAAEHADTYGDIKDGQYVYVDSKVSDASQEEGKPIDIPPPHRREQWTPVDGSRKGLIREAGRGQWTTDPDPKQGAEGYEVSTNYRHLSTCPPTRTRCTTGCARPPRSTADRSRIRPCSCWSAT